MTDAAEQAGRQRQLIIERVDDYLARRIGLARLVTDLDGLWNALGSQPEAWRKAFRANWWTLEQVLAVGLDRNDLEGVMSENSSAVQEALVSLRDLAHDG